MSDHSSDNSLAKSDASGDLTSKYNRLAMEYSKMRAQNSVLKKAILTEQSKNADMNDILHSKDQTIRRLEQEMEALKFRNSQLSVRVTVLQETIADLSTNSKKKNKQPEKLISVNTSHPGDVEIERTMMEHAKLISELCKKDEQYEGENRMLKNEIRSLKFELEQKSEKLKQLASNHQATNEQLKEEQQEMKRIYANNVMKLREMEVQLSKMKMSHNSTVNGFTDKNVKLDVYFSASSNNYDDNLLALRKFFVNLLVALRDVTHNNKLDVEGLNLKKTVILFDTYLNECDAIFRNELKTYYHFLDNMKFPDSSTGNLQTSAQRFLQSSIQLLLSEGTNTYEICDQKWDSFANLIQLFHTRKNDLVTKINTSTNVEKTLISWNPEILDVAFDKFATLITEVHKQRLNLRAPRNLPGAVSTVKKPPEQTENDVREASSNNTQLEEYISLTNALKEEIKKLEETVTFLEQEHVRFEAAEGHMKEIRDLSKKVLADPANKIGPITNQLGSFLTPCMFSTEILSQTTRIQECLNEQLNSLVAEKQTALSKARSFFLECKSLQKRLQFAQAEKGLLELEHSSLREMSDKLREELNTVSQNYEVQLSMMSEHVASVNEKLSTLSEEIINLHHQLDGKVSKKNKLK